MSTDKASIGLVILEKPHVFCEQIIEILIFLQFLWPVYKVLTDSTVCPLEIG